MNRTALQSETSRRNGAKSAGPVTAAGRERAAANATRHGILSAQAVLPGESEADLAALVLAYNEKYRPVGKVEEDLVREMALVRWRLRRVVAFESRVMAEGDMDRQIRGVAAATRYETRLQRSYDRAAYRLDAVQGSRRIDASLAAVAAREAKAAGAAIENLPNEPEHPRTIAAGAASPNELPFPAKKIFCQNEPGTPMQAVGNRDSELFRNMPPDELKDILRTTLAMHPQALAAVRKLPFGARL